jgi:DnaK suppressor protein
MAKSDPARKAAPAPKARKPAAKTATPAAKKSTAAAGKGKPAGKKAVRKVVIPPLLKGVAKPLVPILHDEAPAPVAEEARKEATGRKLRPAEVGEIRGLLIKRRAELIAELNEELGQSKVSAQQRRADPTDQASDSADGDLALALAQSDSKELAQIEAALTRAESGGLGVCEECSGPIPMERLRVLPQAITCTACKRKLELQSETEGSEDAWEAVTESEEEQGGEEE